MSTLIRSGKLAKEPLVLASRRLPADTLLEYGQEDGAVPANSPSPHSPTSNDDTSGTAFHSSAHTHASFSKAGLSDGRNDSGVPHQAVFMAEATSAGVAAAALTYAEYKERFQQELELERESAVQDGFREGVERAREQVEAEYAEKLEALSRLVSSAREALGRDIEALHEIGAEIAYEAALKIVGDAAITREGAQAIVREVIKRAKDASRLVVRLSPADFEFTESNRSLVLGGLSVGTVEFVADDRVELGGCLLETPAGNLDGRLEVQLQCLREALLNARIRRADGGNA